MKPSWAPQARSETLITFPNCCLVRQSILVLVFAIFTNPGGATPHRIGVLLENGITVLLPAMSGKTSLSFSKSPKKPITLYLTHKHSTNSHQCHYPNIVLLTTWFRCNPKRSPTLLVAKSVSLIVQKRVKSIGETSKFYQVVMKRKNWQDKKHYGMLLLLFRSARTSSTTFGWSIRPVPR